MLELTLADYSRTLMKEQLLSSQISFHEIGDTFFIRIEGNGHYYKLLNLNKKINSPSVKFKGRYCKLCGTSLQIYGGIPYKKGYVCYVCSDYFLSHFSSRKSLKISFFDIITKRAVSLKLFR